MYTHSNKFIKSADNFPPYIKNTSIDLVAKYVLDCDEEEALAVSNVLQKAGTSWSITANTDQALTQEKSMQPPLMLSLIDESNMQNTPRPPDRTNQCWPQRKML